MSNAFKGEIDMEIDGKKRTLSLPISVLIEIEEALGIGIPRLVLNIDTMQFTISQVICVLYHALAKEVEQAIIMKWIDENGFAEASKRVSKLLSVALEGKGKAPVKDKA